MKSAEIALQLWARLWEDYSHRVEYARIYEHMIREGGGTIANDHIAFRSLRLTIEGIDGKINLGLPYLGGIAEALGYSAVEEYKFPQKHLYARHYSHPEQEHLKLPKLFISELMVEELPKPITEQIEQVVSTGSFFDFHNLNQEIEAASSVTELERIIAKLQVVFTRPWEPPQRSLLEAVNEISQYGAWILLHGYSVNHFTGYINCQNTPQYQDIETTASGLEERGVPMKAEIEGSKGSGLRQTATQAVTEMVSVRDDHSGELIEIPWTYAYYELAERNLVEVGPGQKVLFEGFLSSQARNLFEMTHSRSMLVWRKQTKP
ncbi:MAG: DUF1338 domain-containing protein [Symploca sp. SIO2E9]|nr:DUF1338 domain-containing protein [Symploca sp. SIO2E9]